MIKVVPGEPAKVYVRNDSWVDTGAAFMNLVIAIGKGHKPPTPEGVVNYIVRQLISGGYMNFEDLGRIEL